MYGEDKFDTNISSLIVKWEELGGEGSSKEEEEVLHLGGKVLSLFVDYLCLRMIRKQTIQEVFKLHFQIYHTFQTAAILSVKGKLFCNHTECREGPYWLRDGQRGSTDGRMKMTIPVTQRNSGQISAKFWGISRGLCFEFSILLTTL